ncbi:hypothetical protein XBKB1_2160001 [Xenorhabdus bovienii str. kraussei Becker Underwood]|uniref:Uncharacterized protein n=1 Tax=Xenorhabdus bovienii str. kraussei Becker Underwood TaxID=1398204 RepID=A0A077PTE1_XENBV|nr:hypothetical protein XBKB1_2160001 [Xenorhabdus bovienii str. kraussei Becker Underwood]
MSVSIIYFNNNLYIEYTTISLCIEDISLCIEDISFRIKEISLFTVVIS